MKKWFVMSLVVILLSAVSSWAASKTVISRFGGDKYGAPLFFPDADKNPASLGL